VDQQQQSRRWPASTQLALITIGAAVVFVVIVVFGGYHFGWKLTGYPKRTPWDWADLLIIPFVLALGGYLFALSENRATRDAAEQRAQDEALQAYLDQMGQMLLDKDRPLRQSAEGQSAEVHNEARTLARARTLTVLTVLDGHHKRSMLRFLPEALLINKDDTVVDLSGADLSGADLRGAKGWTAKQLSEARTLEGATMPDGQVLKSADNPDGPTFEEWRKSKGRGEDGENSGPSHSGVR
jgi:hypothetical protein